VRNFIDFTTWQGVLSALLGIALFSLVAVGIRLLLMQTVQQRRERENRQINERLKTLIAAYKTLGGSFTGDLAVDPRHWRELRQGPGLGGAGGVAGGDSAAGEASEASEEGLDAMDSPQAAGAPAAASSDRRRRMRDAVEAALSDVLLLGTEDQVRLAARAAEDMVAGRTVHTAELVVSLRTFIRDVLDLDPLPSTLSIPRQGPLRPAVGGASSRGARGERAGAGGAAGRGGGRQGGGDGSVGLAAHGGANVLRGDAAPDAAGPGSAAP
jgi:hypothetical protein